VCDANYAAVLDAIGEVGVAELVFTMGHYHNICMLLNAFNVPIPAGNEMPFPEPLE
jgi:hypothetical protein